MARSSQSDSKEKKTTAGSKKGKASRKGRSPVDLREFELTPDEPEEEVEPAPPKPGNWLTRTIFRPRLLIGLSLVLTAVYAGPGLVKFLPNPAEQEDWQITVERIHITDPPHWIPRDFVEQVVHQAGLPETMSLRDETLVGKIASAFAGHPWVLRVKQVQKGWPARIDITLEYRRPVAMVEVAGGLYPVDADSVLLPPGDFSIADTRLYPLVLGASSTPQGTAGKAWGDAQILGAARLADVLSDYWKKFHLTTIHLPRLESTDDSVKDSIFQLETTGGSRIIWGRAPGSGHPGELTAAQKIGRLERYQEEYTSFEKPDGPYEIDIRHWQEIARRRLPETTSNRSSRPRR